MSIWKKLLCIISLAALTISAGPVPKKSKPAPAVREPAEHSILCDEKKPQSVRVAYGRVTVINFPFKPKDVVPGETSFDFKQIKNDLVIKALNRGGRTNLLVYLEDRRCAFDLTTVLSRGDDILVVRDAKDDQIGVSFYE